MIFIYLSQKLHRCPQLILLKRYGTAYHNHLDCLHVGIYSNDEQSDFVFGSAGKHLGKQVWPPHAAVPTIANTLKVKMILDPSNITAFFILHLSSSVNYLWTSKKQTLFYKLNCCTICREPHFISVLSHSSRAGEIIFRYFRALIFQKSFKRSHTKIDYFSSKQDIAEYP